MSTGARFDKTPEAPARLPARHGEQMEEILAGLGYDAEARFALRSAGIVQTAEDP